MMNFTYLAMNIMFLAVKNWITDRSSQLAGRSISLKHFNDTFWSVHTDAMDTTGVGFFTRDDKSLRAQSFSRAGTIPDGIRKRTLLKNIPRISIPNVIISDAKKMLNSFQISCATRYTLI